MSRKNVENHIFQQAIKSGAYECLFMLLQNRCKIDVTSNITPLMFAITNGMTDAIEPLLDLGLDPYYVTLNGYTALSHACEVGDEKAVKILCDRMDIIEIPTSNADRFSSIAKYAVSSKKLSILEMVLKKGCDLNRYDHINEVPADSIRGLIDDELSVKFIELMVHYGFDINVRSPKTQLSFLDRLMDFATVGKFPKLCHYLLSNGADVKHPSQNGKTLLDKIKTWKKQNRTNRKMYYDIFRYYYPEIQS